MYNDHISYLVKGCGIFVNISYLIKGWWDFCKQGIFLKDLSNENNSP
jgi:hypothetical protein